MNSRDLKEKSFVASWRWRPSGESQSEDRNVWNPAWKYVLLLQPQSCFHEFGTLASFVLALVPAGKREEHTRLTIANIERRRRLLSPCWRISPLPYDKIHKPWLLRVKKWAGLGILVVVLLESGGAPWPPLKKVGEKTKSWSVGSRKAKFFVCPSGTASVTPWRSTLSYTVE